MFLSSFTFLQSISAHKKSHWLTQLLLRYSWFQNSVISLVESIFDHTLLNIYKLSFEFLEVKSLCQKMKVIHQFFASSVFRSCNLIGLKCFRLWLKNQNFLEYGHNANSMNFHFRMGLFGAAHEWGKGKKTPIPKFSHTYPTMMRLGAVKPCQEKIQNKYKWRDTRLEFCWNQYFFTGNQQLSYIR